MPVYDYVCNSCRHRFEVFRGLNESGPSQCPLCEGPVTRAFAPPTIVFKGSGWAKKDRRPTRAPSTKAAADQSKGGDSAPAAPGSGESASGESRSRESASGESRSRESNPTSSGSDPSTSGGSASRDSKPGESKSTSSGSGESKSTSSGSGE
jgi:putative FmdB family regulatory protein